MENQNRKNEYTLFNGRRSADEYVKGYLKGIAVIACVLALIAIPFGVWCTNRIIDLQILVTSIESSRFTIKDGHVLEERIGVNTISFAKLQALLEAQSSDLDEIKTLLRRSSPYEIRALDEGFNRK